MRTVNQIEADLKARDLQVKYAKFIDDIKVKVHKITHNKNPKYKTGMQRVSDLQIMLDLYLKKLQNPKSEAEKYTAKALVDYIGAQIEYLKSKEVKPKATKRAPQKIENNDECK